MIDTDYLIVGAGAAGLAFADACDWCRGVFQMRMLSL